MGMDLAVTGVDHQPFIIRRVDQDRQQLLPKAPVPPADKTAVRVAPSAVFRRKIPPGRPRPQYPASGIDEAAIVLGDAAPEAFASGQMLFQQCPDLVGYIMATIGWIPVFHASLLLRLADSLITPIS